MEIFNISSIQFWKSNSVSSFLQDKWNSIQIFQAKVPCLHPKTIVFVETKTWKHVVSTYSISISRSPFRMAPAEFCSRPCRKYESSCSFHWAELLRTMSVGLPRFVFCWLPRCFCFLYMEATPTSEVTWKNWGKAESMVLMILQLDLPRITFLGSKKSQPRKSRNRNCVAFLAFWGPG